MKARTPRGAAMMADLAQAQDVIENGATAPAAEAATPEAPAAAPKPQEGPQRAAGAVAVQQPAQTPVPAEQAVQQPVFPDWAATEAERPDPGVPLNVRVPTDLFYELRDFCMLTRLKQKDVVAEALRKQLALLKFERAEAAKRKKLGQG